MLSMARGCRLSARVFFLISLPVSRFPLLVSAWKPHGTNFYPMSGRPPHRLVNSQTITAQPSPGSLQSWPPCRTEPSSSWPRRQPSSWPPLPLFCGVPPTVPDLWECWSRSVAFNPRVKRFFGRRCFVLPRSCSACPSPSLLWLYGFLPSLSDGAPGGQKSRRRSINQSSEGFRVARYELSQRDSYWAKASSEKNTISKNKKIENLCAFFTFVVERYLFFKQLVKKETYNPIFEADEFLLVLLPLLKVDVNQSVQLQQVLLHTLPVDVLMGWRSC